MELEEHRIKATRELYKVLYTEGKNTKLEDVKRCVENGAYLSGIRLSYGIPLLYAIKQSCTSDIIAYLVEKGGLDWDYKEPSITEHYDAPPKKRFVECIDYIVYDSIMNELIRKKYYYTNNKHIIQNKILKQYKKERPTFQYFKKKSIKNYVADEEDIMIITRLKEYCMILNIKYDDLDHRKYVLPEIVRYLYCIDYKDYFPSDDEPYFWKPRRINKKVEIITDNVDTVEDKKNKATKELYRILYKIEKREKKAKLEDIKKCVEDGAYLNGIRVYYGLPLLYAISILCPPDIIAYLVEKGGIDWTYKEPVKSDYYRIHPNKRYRLYFTYIFYYSIMNVLISKKYYYTNNGHILKNLTFRQFKKECPRFKYFKQTPKHIFIMGKKSIQTIKLLKEYCKILNIKYEDLHHKNFELPDVVHYDDERDYGDYFPKDDQPYYYDPENDDDD
jgi:hypothetical protein